MKILSLFFLPGNEFFSQGKSFFYPAEVYENSDFVFSLCTTLSFCTDESHIRILAGCWGHTIVHVFNRESRCQIAFA